MEAQTKHNLRLEKRSLFQNKQKIFSLSQTHTHTYTHTHTRTHTHTHTHTHTRTHTISYNNAKPKHFV